MSASHFEREKTPTKSAIGTIKRHERRKKLRRNIYQVKQETNKRFIKNLSNFELTQAQISLLSRGLKSIPTPVTNESHIRAQLLNDFKAFARRMRLQYIFYGQEKEPHSFHVKSNWEPPVQPSQINPENSEPSKSSEPNLTFPRPQTVRLKPWLNGVASSRKLRQVELA